MTLGFSVQTLLPDARGGGKLRMGLKPIPEADWLQPNPDIATRKAAFAADPTRITIFPEAEEPGAELAQMLGLQGGLAECAQAHWEDMCLLTRDGDTGYHRLVGAAVAFPTGWDHNDRMGQRVAQMHAHIHGYSEQLADGVDHFMDRLEAGPIFGRANWFVAPTSDLHWRVEPPEQAFAHVTPDNAGEALFVRSERQTLRRLPQSGAILFAIGVYVEPLRALPSPTVQWLSKAVQAIPAGERERRGIDAYLVALSGYAKSKG
ncbi:heme-dependent oxidative N-demethylase subunit alpha family protein [uncultured Erythrobacter sp.]|uniref:heme-dependent oxidative N-demethylase subunit alpha family protein n=1 Tax=uncultured Erythrobacter sp. TaxID=263913 RepID=UPI0026311685|nr:heme-dependent oxidative N-demethylase subunit alpha family protein [uncultured Erythrobacter sp.]